jgi:PAS domain S-box-containing protein
MINEPGPHAEPDAEPTATRGGVLDRRRSAVTSPQFHRGGVATWKLNGVLTGANDELLRLIGRTREELEAGELSWQAVTPAEYLQADAAQSADLQRFRMHPPYEKDLVRGNGSRVPVVIAAAMLENSDDEAISFVLDATERRHAEQALRLLARSSEAVGSSLDCETNVQAIAQLVLDGFADYCMIDLQGDDGRMQRVAALAADPLRQPFMDVLGRDPPAETDSARGLGSIIQSGEPLLLNDLQGRHSDFLTSSPDAVEALSALELRALLAVPMLGRRGAVGVLSCARSSDAPFGENDLSLALELGRRTATAVENARSFVAERDARQRLEILARAGQLLAGGGALDVVLTDLASLFTSSIADYCVTYLLEEGGVLRRASATHAVPAKRDLVEQLLSLPDPTIHDGYGVGLVVARGETVLAADISGNELAVASASAEQMAIYRALDPSSSIVAPLRARGRLVGAMAVVTVHGGRPAYSPRDVALVEELATRAALAVDAAHLLERARSASRAKSDFLAVMSHELRTPLNAIGGYAQLMQEGIGGSLSTLHADYVRRIAQSQRHLLGLIDEVLTISRLESGRMVLRTERVALAEVLAEVEDMIETQLVAKGLSYHRDRLPADFTVAADADKLRQILLNLLHNAVKFTNNGEVRVTAESEEDMAVVRVRDTGVGIPPDQLELIFEPFSQVETQLARRAHGVGLGLSISRSLALAMGGDISATSEAGHGSTFTLRVPRG